jgi:serine/threonine protein kinase
MADVRPRQRRLLGHRYTLEGLIGRGGMAEVYRARDRLLGRSVAVKVLRSAAVTEEERARFTAEARTLARLRHPGVVTILDAATRDDQPYLVMELVDGRSLAAHCRESAMEPTRVAFIGVQLADALAHAHAAGVIHRDLKPGNVLLDADDRVTLADFGIAMLMSDTTRHTTTGVTVGTAAYLSPEQVRGDAITPASDVYSLGLLLLEALTGRRVYRGAPVEAALARLTTPPAIPSTVPSPWHELLPAMTALDPTERLSAAQVAASLRDLASGSEPATAPSHVGRVHGDGPAQPTSRARFDGGTIGIHGLAPEVQPRSNHVVPARRRRVAGFAALLLIVVSAAVMSDASGARSASSASTPQGSATVPIERRDVGSNAERPSRVVAAASGPLPSLRSESGSPRPMKTRDHEHERQAASGQPIGQRNGQARDGSRESVDKQHEKHKRDEVAKRGKKDKKAKAAA